MDNPVIPAPGDGHGETETHPDRDASSGQAAEVGVDHRASVVAAPGDAETLIDRLRARADLLNDFENDAFTVCLLEEAADALAESRRLAGEVAQLQQLADLRWDTIERLTRQHNEWKYRTEAAEGEVARLNESLQRQGSRMPTAWGEFGDGHDYSRTGKHDPLMCRYCLKAEVARLRAQVREA